MTEPRRRRSPSGSRPERSDPGAEVLELIRMLAEGLPDALDDEMAARLAARVRPSFLSASADGGEAPSDRLLTVAEAASRAHVHAETIRRAVREGRLAIAGRVGRSARIRAAEVDRWLAGDSDEVGQSGRRRCAASCDHGRQVSIR